MRGMNLLRAKQLPGLLAPVLCLLLAARLSATQTGPTLQLDYGGGRLPDNPLAKFMYFVPLISDVPVCVYTNAGNSQRARVLSFHCRTNGASVQASCEFEFAGTGVERNVFDYSAVIRRHEKDLKAGKLLQHQLESVNIEGSGRGSIEITGTLTKGPLTVTAVRLCFNARGHASPVTICLGDYGYAGGAVRSQNELVARVNELIFEQKPGPPKMEVSLASVEAKDAGNGLWQDFMGGLKGMAANLFLPPLGITRDGHQAIMSFGRALATEQSAFTFPFATRLKSTSPAGP